MKNFKYILLFLAVSVLASCFEDKSTDAINPLSTIIVESGIDSVYNLEKNEVLVIKPVISQENTPKELKYTWEIDEKVYSNADTLSFVAKSLGVFNARFIVENEDGKTFFVFRINVNSPYEEGLTVISKDDETGESRLSFMLTPLNSHEKAQFYDYDCFAANNEDLSFASNVVDVVHTTNSLVVACQGSDAEKDFPTIYFLNDKTFVMENIIEVSEYEGFKPTKMMIPSSSSAGVSYHLLSADGKVYGLPVYDAVLQPSTKLFSTYSQSCIVVDDGVSSYYDVLFWDKEAKNVALMYNGYGPYYYGEKYLLQREDSVFETDNYFKSINSFVAMTSIRRTKEQVSKSEREMLVLVKSKYDVQKLVISTFPWRGIDGKPGKYTIEDNGGFKLAGTKSPLNENTPCIANKTFLSLLFADGNNVRRWYYTSSTYINKADTLLTVGSDDTAVITSFDISADHKKTYVAFYEPNSDKELNGSVWVFDTDTGEILEKHNNVCYKPVKVIYKKK